MFHFLLFSSYQNILNMIRHAISAYRLQQLAYVAYVQTSTFIDAHLILDVHTFTHTLIFFPMIFSKFKNFSGSYNFILFKNLLLYIWPLIYFFVLGGDKFFTVCICFKETYFSWNKNFSLPVFNKYFSFTLSTCQFRTSVKIVI